MRGLLASSGFGRSHPCENGAITSNTQQTLAHCKTPARFLDNVLNYIFMYMVIYIYATYVLRSNSVA